MEVGNWALTIKGNTMATLWMITNREQKSGELGKDAGPLTFWRTDKTGTEAKLKKLSNWEELTPAKFVGELRRYVDEDFPELPDDENEHEHHVTLFVHGFNNGLYLDDDRVTAAAQMKLIRFGLAVGVGR